MNDSQRLSEIYKKVALLLNWFDLKTTTLIGDPDYNYLIERLMNDGVSSFTNADRFFAKHRIRENYRRIYIKQEEQESFNQRIMNFMVMNNLSWEYYKFYIK